MRKFRSFNYNTCKTVLLEAIYLKLRKIVVERVTVVKFPPFYLDLASTAIVYNFDVAAAIFCRERKRNREECPRRHTFVVNKRTLI